MNYMQTTLPPRGIARQSEIERNLPPVRNGVGERRSGYRSFDAGLRTTSVRRRFRANTWNTQFYTAAILPTQFFTDPGHASESSSGAQRLMFAVLQDAVVCWFRYSEGHSSRSQRLFQETYEWFWTQTPSGLYAFENICEVFKLDPDYIRRGLMRWHPSVQQQHFHPSARRPYVPTRRSVRSPAVGFHSL